MRIQITNGMLMALIINLMYAKAIGLTQGSIAREVGSDMWISTLFSIIQGLLVMVITVFIIRKMPDKDIIQQSEQLIGKWFSKGIALMVFLFFLYAFGAILSTFIYHLKDFFLPEAPIIVMVIASVLLGMYGIIFGLEVVSRMALLGVFSILCLNILIIFGSVQDFDVRELFPTFQSGVTQTLWASRHLNGDWAIATMAVAMILPYVKSQKVWGKSAVSGIVYGGIFIVMWPILEAGVLSAEVTAQYFVSCMQMARSAHMGNFFHRYEMVMVAFFALSSLTQIMIALLCATIAMQRMFGAKDYRPLIFPTGLIIGAFGYWFVFDHERAMNLLETQWVVVAMGVAIGLPLLIFVLQRLLKKKLLKKGGVTPPAQ